MTWAQPIVLWGLLGPALATVTLLVLAFLRRHRRWTRWPGITRIVAIGSRVHPVGVAHGTRRPWLLLLALGFALLALAGPRWGSIDEPIYQRSREVMLALDLSRSMLVEDVLPSRLERSRLLLRNLLDGLKGERVGLIVFAGTAFVQVPMSADYQILEEFLPELKPDTMPQGGTDYDGMLRSAIGGFSEAANTDRYLIVLSDGEATTEGWRESIPALKQKEIHVIALGVGTTAGGFIPDAKSGGFVKDSRGAVVLSHLEPATLQALASETTGTYRDASDWVDLAAVLAETIERGRQGTFTEKRSARAIERFQWFLAPALLLALLGVWREVPARPRTRHIRQITRGTAGVATVAVLVLTLVLSMHAPLRAAVQDTTPQPGAEKLRSTVKRLAATESVAPAGWKAMAEQTLALASEATPDGKPIEPGLVHDALQAVDAGEALDPRAADWAKLREDLLRLLEPPPAPPEQKQDEQKQDEEKKQNQEQEEKDQKSDQQHQQENQDQQQSGDDGKPEEEKSEQSQQNQQPEKQDQQQQSEAQPQKQDSAMGDLQNSEEDRQPPPQPPKEQQQPQQTRKFGGKQNDRKEEPPSDPELAAAMARLRQIGESDSPARLHQLMEEEAQRRQQRPAPANDRDW